MLNRDNTILVVIDVQGKLATLMHNRDIFVENTSRIIKGCLALQIPIIWNEQLPDKLGETIPQIKDILSGNSPLIKNTFSCVGNKAFVQKLKELDRRQLLLVGMETHVCVYQTAIDLLELGFDIFLVADCVSSRRIENKQIGIEAITAAGARITSVEMALFEMLRVAEGDDFRQVSKIVK
jgi:nicotinamidase-related amidase